MDEAADLLIRDGYKAIPEDLRQARAAVADVFAIAARVADEHMGIVADTKYNHEEDEVGERVCCGVVSYEPHAADCDAVLLRAALSNAQGEGK